MMSKATPEERAEAIHYASPRADCVTQVTQAIREAVVASDREWTDEIEKHYPAIKVMSFCGPEFVIPWLIKQVEAENK